MVPVTRFSLAMDASDAVKKTSQWAILPQTVQLPGFGIESTADEIGAFAAGATAAGIAAHAIGTNIMKKNHSKSR